MTLLNQEPVTPVKYFKHIFKNPDKAYLRNLFLNKLISERCLWRNGGTQDWKEAEILPGRANGAKVTNRLMKIPGPKDASVRLRDGCRPPLLAKL